MSFTVHALENCPYSINAVNMLEKMHMPAKVTWIKLNEKSHYRSKQGWKSDVTFPQIYYSNYYIGGSKELKKLLKVVKTCRKYNIPIDVVKKLIKT